MRYPAESQRSVSIEAVDLADDATSAKLEICTVSDGEVYLIATEQVVSSGARTTRTTETMIRDGDSWKLSEREVTSIENGAKCKRTQLPRSMTSPNRAVLRPFLMHGQRL